MDEDDEDIQKSLHYAIGKISQSLVEEEGDFTAKVKLSPDAIAALTELTFQFATTSLAKDIMSFSAHANRSIASAKDVRLVLRKAPLRIREEFDKLCEEKCSTGSTKATLGTNNSKPYSLEAPKKPARKNDNKKNMEVTSTKYSDDEDSDIAVLSSTQKRTRFLDASPSNEGSSSSGEDDYSDNIIEKEQANKKEKPEWKKSNHTTGTSCLDIESSSSSSDEAEFHGGDVQKVETEDIPIRLEASNNTDVECIDLSGDC